MNYFYLVFNLVVAIGPLMYIFLTKDGRDIYIPKIKGYLFSIFSVGTIFIIWDIIVTRIGHWGFNKDYVLGLYFVNLPFEEVLFFLTVPFALLFTYDVLKFHIGDNAVKFNDESLIFISILLILLSLNFNGYTSVVLAYLSILIFIVYLTNSNLLNLKVFWIYTAIHYALFITFNLFLTALPVVIYGEEFITNIRFITIPIEDFLYSFALSTSLLLVHSWYKSFAKNS